jgi:hypothetical protein
VNNNFLPLSLVPSETTKIPIARVPNTNKHSNEGSNPIWMKAYDNDWFKNDDNLSQGSNGNDSLDENVLVNNEFRVDDENFMRNMSKSKEINGLHTQNNLIKHLTMYHQIDKFTNHAAAVTKKLETTEL